VDDNWGMHPTTEQQVRRGTGGPARLPALALALAVVTVLGLSACGGDDAKVAAPPNTVRMGEFYYRPADITVAAGAEVTVVNDGTVIHNWIVKGAGVGTAELRPGQSIIVSLKGIKPGTYTVYCDQPGHAEAGQVGTLTIT
jgi:plastocyanin